MDDAPPSASGLPAYAELHCLSHFSFQRGASHPGELVERACQLGYSALALTDDCSVAGVVRAHTALESLRKQALAQDRPVPPLQLLIGSEFTITGWPDIPGHAAFKLVALARPVDEAAAGQRRPLARRRHRR